MSVLATHAVAGPLIRLERIGRRLAAGELTETVHIRQGDDLQAMQADSAPTMAEMHVKELEAHLAGIEAAIKPFRL